MGESASGASLTAANSTGLMQMTFVASRQKSSGDILAMDEVSSVSAGGQFSLFLRADGTTYAAGSNLFGQLGTGKTESFRGVAQQVLNSSGTALTKITMISAGVSHALAVDEDGNAWGWGDNSSGQLGTSVSGTSASRATKIASGVLSVAAGARHSLLLTQAGKILAYGADDFGQKLEPTGLQAKWCPWPPGKIMDWQWTKMAGFGVGATIEQGKFLLTVLFQPKGRCADSAPPFLLM